VTRLQAKRPKVRFSTVISEFFFIQSFEVGSVAQMVSLSVGICLPTGHSLQVERSGHEAIHLTPQCAEVKNCRRYVYTDLHSPYVDTVCKGAPLPISRRFSQNYEKRLLASPCLSIRPQGKIRIPLDRFLWNFIFEYFSKVRWGNSISIKSGQE